MTQILVAKLATRIDAAGTAASLYLTAGKEYLGANRPTPDAALGAAGTSLHFAPRIVEFLSLNVEAFGDGQTFGEMAVGEGTLKLANADGALDAWLGYGFDAGVAEFALVAGEQGDWSTRQTILVCTMRQARAGLDSGLMEIDLEDARAAADTLWQSTLFAGTNSGSSGVEGLADDLKNRPKPDALGWVFNAPVPVVNSAANIAQLDSRRVQNIADQALYDGQVPITRGTARASLAALQSNSPSVGTFDYYLGGSEDGAYVKSWRAPQYGWTADIEGKAESGTFRALPGALWRWALTTRGGVSGSLVSSTDADAVDAAAPYELGLWIDAETTVREVCNAIAASALGFWGKDATGVYRFFLLKDPAAETPAATFRAIGPLGAAAASEGDIVSLERVDTRDEGLGLPARDILVGYKRFWAVQREGLDTAAAAARRVMAGEEWRWARPSAALSTVTTQFPRAPVRRFETAIAFEADAVAFANRAAALFNATLRARYQVTLRVSAATAAVEIGAVIRIVFDRFGLAAGKNFVVLGQRFRSFAQDQVGEFVTASIWG